MVLTVEAGSVLIKVDVVVCVIVTDTDVVTSEVVVVVIKDVSVIVVLYSTVFVAVE